MLQTTFKMQEDPSGSMTIKLWQEPWEWGGPGLAGMIAMPLTWPLMRLLYSKSVVFDKPLGRMLTTSRYLLRRSTSQTAFSEVQRVEGKPLVSVSTGQVQASAGYAGVQNLCDLGLVLVDGGRVSIVVVWPDSAGRSLAEKLATLMHKPLTWLGSEMDMPAKS